MCCSLTLEERAAPQKGLRSGHANHLWSKKAKCTALQPGEGNAKHRHGRSSAWIECNHEEEDLGLLGDAELNTGVLTARKAARVLCCTEAAWLSSPTVLCSAQGLR